MGNLCRLSCAGWRWGRCLGPASAPSFRKAPSRKETLSWSRRLNSVLNLFSQFARVQLSFCACSPHPTGSVDSWGYKPWAPGASGHVSPTGRKKIKIKKIIIRPHLSELLPQMCPISGGHCPAARRGAHVSHFQMNLSLESNSSKGMNCSYSLLMNFWNKELITVCLN